MIALGLAVLSSLAVVDGARAPLADDTRTLVEAREQALTNHLARLGGGLVLDVLALRGHDAREARLIE